MAKVNKQSKDYLIANLLQKNYSYESIKETLKTGNSRISRVAKQLKNNSPIIETAKVWRPPKVTPEIKQFINIETIEDPRIGGVKLSEKIALSLGVTLSSTTINQIRNLLKFSYTHPRRRQFLNEKQIQNRISFCQNQLEGEIDWSEMVVFSDESRFCLRDDSRKVWVKRGYYNEKTFCNEKKYDRGIMVWGAIGKGWRSHLILVKGRLNANGYS